MQLAYKAPASYISDAPHTYAVGIGVEPEAQQADLRECPGGLRAGERFSLTSIPPPVQVSQGISVSDMPGSGNPYLFPAPDRDWETEM